MREAQAFPTHRVEMGRTARGLYESFYFRGNRVGGGPSFWLKHNLLRFSDSDRVMVETTMIGFPERGDEPRVLRKSCETVTPPGPDWDAISFDYGDGSFFSITRDALSGAIHTAEENVSWDLRLSRSDEPYYHFASPWLYRSPFPKKKILTRDTLMGFDGVIQWGGRGAESWSGSFIGMNGHNWGTEHAYTYAYADCNEWQGGRTAYFDGFSAKIKIASATTPFLSLCSLRTEHGWFHFNKLLSAHRHRVRLLTNRSWSVAFESDGFILDVEIEGEGRTWASLRYLHPNRSESMVENTKTARGALTLTDKGTGRIVDRWFSDRFELETLLHGH